MQQQRLENGKGIFRLWFNWLLGSAALTLLILLSLWVRPLYMPFVAFGLQLCLFTLIRRNRALRLPQCYLFPFIVSRVLFWSGTVMLVINLLYSRWLVDKVFDLDTVNPDIPFICILIVAPITTAICFWAFTHRGLMSFCRDCKLRVGTTAERGFLGMIYHRESRYQTLVSLVMSAVVTVVTWGYYALTYVNTSLSVPDRFVFFWAETLAWLTVAIYFGMRYLGIWGYYRQNIEGSTQRHGRSTQLRYIMVADNLVALRQPQTNADSLISSGSFYFDTPESAYIRRHESVDLADARHYFYNLTDIDPANLRFFYANTAGNADCNIFHYLVFVTPEEKERFDQNNPDCLWVTFRDLVDMLNDNKLNPLLSAEIVRLYTVTMAWKTYDRNGRRRYKIKHYKPTFHLDDLPNHDVDYNDVTWLYVADNNQDTPFYRLRRLWRKYISGVGNYLEEIESQPLDDDNRS